MRTIMRSVAVVAGAATVAALWACGERPGSRAGSGPIHPQWTTCADARAASAARPLSDHLVPLPHIEADFRPSVAVMCEVRTRPHPDGGPKLVEVEVERRTEEVAALLAALRLPDAPPTTTEVC